MVINMIISVNVKKIGKKIASVEPTPFEIEGIPTTAEELVTACVRSCVAAYNSRIDDREPRWISDEHFAAMAAAGKMAFGLPFSDKKADANEAVQTALQAFDDGLFRAFVGETELESRKQAIKIGENSEVTFIRLTMLAGRIL